MVNPIELRRDRVIFRWGSSKYEYTIEPRYWRNPIAWFSLLIISPIVLYFLYPALLPTIISANLLAAIAIPVSLMVMCTGRFTFGPQFFIGVGGYTAALLSVHYGLGPAGTLIPSLLMSLVFGLLVSPIAIVARGLYYTLLTLILPLAFLEVTFIYVGIFKGDVGLSGVVRLVTLPSAKLNFLAVCFLSLALMGIYLYIVDKVIRSRFGLAMAAINDDEEVAQTMGVDVNKIKVIGFSATATMIGIVGWFFAHYHGTFAGVTYLPYFFAVKILLAVIIGGRAQIYGCILGSYFISFLDLLLIRTLGDYAPIIYFVVLLVLLFALPEGLFGLYRKRRYREYYPVMRVRR